MQVVEQIDQTNDVTTYYDYSDSGFEVDSEKYHIRITDGRDKTTYIKLDAFGRHAKTLYPSGDCAESVYSLDGRLTAEAVWDQQDAKRWINYFYDPYSRIADANYPDQGNVHYSYDGFGKLVLVEDNRNSSDNIGGSGEIAYEYDPLGRLLKTTDQDGYVVSFAWRGDGQKELVEVERPSDSALIYQVAYLYDAAGRLEYVSEPLLGASTGWVAKLAYDDNGNREQLKYYLDGTLNGDAVSIGYGYNRDNRLTGFSTTGGVTFGLSNTAIDGLGRLRAGTEVITDTSANTRTHVHSYSYDMRSQLESASITNIDGSTWTASLAYNKDGNIASQTINGTPATFGYNGDLLTAKGSSSIDWNANGCMIECLTSSLTYNWDGKLRTGTAGANSISVKYNPAGDRVYKESTSGQTTTKRRYIVAAIDRLPVILLETDPDGNDPNKIYIYANGQVVAQHSDDYDDVYFYLHDRLGSVREVINTSAAVVNTYTYEPFGQMFASEKQETVGNPFTFTGQYHDAEIGQYYLRARQKIHILLIVIATLISSILITVVTIQHKRRNR